MKPTVWPQIWVAGGIRIRYEHGELDGVVASPIASNAQFRTVLLHAAVANATGEAKTSRDASGPHTLSSQRASVENQSTRSRRRERSLDAKWMLALKENVHSPDYCERGTHGGAKRQALDLPTRRPRFYSSRAPRQFHHSTAWKHGRADDFFVSS